MHAVATRPATAVDPAAVDRSFAARWKHPELFKNGYIPVPISLLKHYRNIKDGVGLTPPELLFVLHLLEFKWTPARPFPSYARLAKNMGVGVKMARRYAKQLEDKGFLRREIRQGNTNQFDLEPLFDALLVVSEPDRRFTLRKNVEDDFAEDVVF